jgi:peptidoglycan-associated lipoprotein
MKTKLFAAALVMCALAACSSPPVKETAAPAPAATPAPPAAPTAAPAPAPSVAGNPLDDPKNILYKRSVYFDFDKYDIKPEYQPLLQAHARYLASHSGARVSIEGNCAETGSPESNLARGQKRADNAKNAMKLLGASEAQIESVSFGKEKPKSTGHDEASRAENRRDDIVYKIKQ